MDKYVKQSIDARRDAIFAAYQVGDEGKKKIDKLFAEIEKLGETAKDAGDFEAKFAASPLNQQYLDLFTEIATTSNATTTANVEKPKIGKTIAGGVAAGVAESALDDVARRVVPTRAAVNQKATDIMRDTPVVGDAMDISQKAGYAMHIGKLFRKKDKKKED